MQNHRFPASLPFIHKFRIDEELAAWGDGPCWNVREVIPGDFRLMGKRPPRRRATLGLVRQSARAGRKVAEEDAGDSIAATYIWSKAN